MKLHGKANNKLLKNLRRYIIDNDFEGFKRISEKYPHIINEKIDNISDLIAAYSSENIYEIFIDHLKNRLDDNLKVVSFNEHLGIFSSNVIAKSTDRTVEKFQWLVRHGFDVNLACIKYKLIDTALTQRHGTNLELIEELLKMDIQSLIIFDNRLVSSHSCSILDKLHQVHDEEYLKDIIRLLIKYDVNFNAESKWSRQNFIFPVSYFKSLDVLKFIINHCNIDLNVRNKEGLSIEESLNEWSKNYNDKIKFINEIKRSRNESSILSNIVNQFTNDQPTSNELKKSKRL